MHSSECAPAFSPCRSPAGFGTLGERTEAQSPGQGSRKSSSRTALWERGTLHVGLHVTYSCRTGRWKDVGADQRARTRVVHSLGCPFSLLPQPVVASELTRSSFS